MTAEELLAQADALLLDFDGPICSVFAGIPAASVADQLRAMLADQGHLELPEAVAASEDPFDVLRYASILDGSEARFVETAFTAHEVEAVPSSTPTSGAHELIYAWHDTGRPIAIVSNNSAAAISAYLDLHNLTSAVDSVAARPSSDPGLLKPSPHLIEQALTEIGIASQGAVFVGDSASDVLAAHRAGVRALGYANKPGKDKTLKASGADAITATLAGLAALRGTRS